jgi:hypothetical protein
MTCAPAYHLRPELAYEIGIEYIECDPHYLGTSKLISEFLSLTGRVGTYKRALIGELPREPVYCQNEVIVSVFRGLATV